MRVWVLGAPGAGKTTLASRLADETGARHIELDGLIWARGWERVTPDRAAADLNALLREEHWIVDGSYPELDSQVAALCDEVVLLDPPRYVRFWRLLRRSWSDALGRHELWNGNRQTWSAGVRLLLWSWRADHELAQRRGAIVDSLKVRGVTITGSDRPPHFSAQAESNTPRRNP